MNENFETFKENVANLVKRIVLDHIESHCLSFKQCKQLCDNGFPYFPTYTFLLPTNFIVYYSNHGKITKLMTNTEINSFLDKHYMDKFNNTNQKECVFNDAVNEIWRKCLYSMQGIVEFRNYIDWDKQFPMIKSKYRI